MKPDDPRYCAFCGVTVGEHGPATEPFGEPFCSEAHAEEFVESVRAARVQAAASSVQVAAPSEVAAEMEAGAAEEPAGTIRSTGASQPTWTDRLKKWGCWGAPLLLLLALPLVNSGGGVATAAGSLLSVLALLACPLGMYFMMRSMASMSRGQSTNDCQKNNAAGNKKDE